MSASGAWLPARARATPERIALEVGGASLSWRDLDARARALAGQLAACGVAPGDTVAALLPNGLPFVLLLHALQRIAATLLPLNARLGESELLQPLRDGRADLLVHAQDEAGARARSAAERAGVRAISQPELARLAPKPVEGGPRASPAALALLFTSGTSGAPKGAELPAASFAASAAAAALHQPALPGDRWLCCLPLYHVGGLSLPIRSLLQGTTCVLHERFEPERVSRELDAGRIAGVSLVATILERILELRGERPPPASLRCALLGGSGAALPLLERARACGWPIAPTYGLTEACSQVATRRLDDRDSPLDAGLAPLAGTELQIRGEDAGVLPAGEPGEILVRGPTLMRGYRGRPEESAAALRGGWLHTGDIGALDERGRLRVLDRRSDLILSGGENIYPAEIESVLLAHPALREAGVAGVPDARFGQRPCAFVVLRPEAEALDRSALVRELGAHCRSRLAGFKQPVAYHFADALPRNASGKLLRRELSALAGRARGASASLAPKP